MPSKSERQRKFMAAACNNPDFAKKVGIDQNVACDFFKADQEEKKTFKEHLLENILSIMFPEN